MEGNRAEPRVAEGQGDTPGRGDMLDQGLEGNSDPGGSLSLGNHLDSLHVKTDWLIGWLVN